MTGPKQSSSVFLIGFMGAGKTTVGKVLAQRLGWKFHDLDELIEHREQRSIAALFGEVGETGFRKLEHAALKALLEESRMDLSSIVALGGGAFVQPENRDALQRAGAVTVLLDAPVEELHRRCEGAPHVRPLAADRNRFEQIFASRHAAYSLAQFKVETAGKEIHEVAREIEQILKKQLAIGN